MHGRLLLLMDHTDAADGLRGLFADVTPVGGVYESPFVSPHENHLRMFVCRGAKIPPLQMLEGARNYH